MDLSDSRLDIWLKNVDNYYNYYNNYITRKAVIGNLVVNSEFLYVRRLFLDWIHSNIDFSNLKKYQSFKSILFKHVKSLPKDNLSFNYIILKDFRVFLKNHSQFLKDIYFDCLSDNKHLFKTHKLLIFSTVCVNLFYKWRQKRNDSKRSWYSYDNRRKKPSNINMVYFDNIMLNEATYTRYKSFLHDNSTYVRVY